ncbi:alkaline phosphatase family protein [Allokutzneria oryzae]|uniref:Alkaline phosphatase family protein n=1 Tax=Allokutzneria oryzae TaxID=1378989 RepID=A0ABV5ZT77_9PSEU
MVEPLAPRYGAGALADLVPSLLSGMNVPGMVNVLGLPTANRVCLLLVDGLGWELLRRHAADAPFLTELARTSTPITAGFPATTATSLAAIGTGLPTGQHGLVGYSFAVDDDTVLNALRWRQREEDLRERVVPEVFQPAPTAFERAAEAGVHVSLVAPRDQNGSGLTRAVLRGGQFRGVHALGDLTARTIGALQAERSFCYAYHADLDALGHLYGPGSDPWRSQLIHVDRLAQAIAERLPDGAVLVVTADHGMVAATDRVDFDAEPLLRNGVRVLGGEARVRHVYAEPGAVDDVRQAWQGFLGDRAWLAHRDEAIAAGWFGPVADHVRPRIGDLVVAAKGGLAITQSAEGVLSGFIGHHGSLTAEEQLIPLLVHQRGVA